MENTYLYHSGVKGMRWGVRKYQNKDGSLTPAGRKRYAKAGASNSKGTAKNKPKAVVKAKAKTEENKPKELTVEEQKAKVLASRSAKELYKNRHLFNYDEMTNAYNLLQRDKQVKDMIVREPTKVEAFFDDQIIPWAKRVKNIVDPAGDVIKKFTEIRDALDTSEGERKAAKENAEIELKRAATKKTNAETERIKSGKEDDRNKANADADKVRAETETEKARTRQAQAEAKRAESRGKFYSAVRKTSGATDNTADATPDNDETAASSKPGKSYTATRGKFYSAVRKTSSTSDDSVSGEVLDKVRNLGTNGSKAHERKTTTYYDVDYVDHTPSRQTTALVSTQSRTSVSSLPVPSTQAKSFVSGLLASSTSNRIQSLDSAGYTNAQIADKLDISTSTVTKYLNDTN